MSPFDPDLLRRLADADAALPPVPGRDFSPASLRALAARRTRRQVMALMAALLLMALVLALRPRKAHAGDAADEFDRSTLRSLCAEVDALRASLREWSAKRAATEQTAAEAALCSAATADLRLQVAQARAGAVLPRIPGTSVEETKR
jgi:hypothetical protein